MKKLIYLILVSALFTACQYSKSVKKDLLTGLTTIGNKLTSEEVFISVNGRKVENNVFTYGERFYINYNDIRGFNRKNGKVYPGMKIFVLNTAGDTIMKTGDLYSESTEGFDINPLQLAADMTVANPMKSNNKYTITVKIWDKQSSGTFVSRFDFKVVPNDKISIELSKATYDEAYLYSQNLGKVIINGKIRYDDMIHVLIEGLKGFKEEDGLVFPGLSLNLTDADNNIIVRYEDLFSDYTKTGLNESDMVRRVSAKFKIEKIDLKNPVTCVVMVWDKKSDSKIKISTDFVIE